MNTNEQEQFELSFVDNPDFVSVPPSTPVTEAFMERFWSYHKQHPQVLREVTSYALQLKRAGRERYGIKGVFEVFRWHSQMNSDKFKYLNGEFKMPNSFTACYARLIMLKEPSLEGFFELRECHADTYPPFAHLRTRIQGKDWLKPYQPKPHKD